MSQARQWVSASSLGPGVSGVKQWSNLWGEVNDKIVLPAWTRVRLTEENDFEERPMEARDRIVRRRGRFREARSEHGVLVGGSAAGCRRASGSRRAPHELAVWEESAMTTMLIQGPAPLLEMVAGLIG